MDLIEGIVKFSSLPTRDQELVIKTLCNLQSNEEVVEERCVQMDTSITEDSARAKEYFKQSECTVPSWIYSNVNWKQVYKTLLKNGFIIEKEDGTVVMKLKSYGRTVC